MDVVDCSVAVDVAAAAVFDVGVLKVVVASTTAVHEPVDNNSHLHLLFPTGVTIFYGTVSYVLSTATVHNNLAA